MSKSLLLSYPSSEARLTALLYDQGFSLEALKPGMKVGSGDTLTKDLSEFLWTDAKFFGICRSLASHDAARWIVNIEQPSHSHYLNQYGIIPTVFSSDISSEHAYYEIITRQIGKSPADAIAFLWERCVVLSSSQKWCFTFDRVEEQGTLYVSNDIVLPNELNLID